MTLVFTAAGAPYDSVHYVGPTYIPEMVGASKGFPLSERIVRLLYGGLYDGCMRE